RQRARRPGHQGLHRQAQRALPRGQRDRLRRQQHDGRRIRDQESEREVELRLRSVAPLLSSRPRCASGFVSSPVTERPSDATSSKSSFLKVTGASLPSRRSPTATLSSRSSVRSPCSRSATTTSPPTIVWLP